MAMAAFIDAVHFTWSLRKLWLATRLLCRLVKPLAMALKPRAHVWLLLRCRRPTTIDTNKLPLQIEKVVLRSSESRK